MQKQRTGCCAEIFLIKWPTTIPASVFTVTAYTSFGLPSSCWQANSSPPPVSKTLWRCDVLIRSCRWWTPCWQILADCSQNCQCCKKNPCQISIYTVPNCLRTHDHYCSQCCGSLAYLYHHLPTLFLHFAMTSLCGTVVQFLIWNRRGDPDIFPLILQLGMGQ